MRSMLQNSKTTNGFTLVEVLVIAPAVILIIAGFIALIITITGDVLNTKNSSDLIYTTEDALARIEQDVQRTTEFRQTSYTPTSPQGQSDNTTAFDTVSQASTYLVLRSQATDKNPIVDSRALIFTASGATCSTNPYTFDTVYFTKVVNGVTSLWRRIVFGSTTDAGTPCSGTTPWQQPTCSPGYTNAFCKADDTLLLTNVSAITLRYLNAAGTQINTTTPTAGTAVSNPNDAAGTTNASSISLSLSVNNTVAGRAGTYTGSLSAKKSPAPAVVSGGGGGGGGGVATFAYTGAVQNWIVPAGITSIQIECWGAQGAPTVPGTGGYAKGNLAVTPGQTLYVYVGQAGAIATGSGLQLTSTTFNGGGRGTTYNGVEGGGSGGGGSDVRTSSALSARVIIAGGGGSGYIYSGAGNPPGGNGGGTNGSNGTNYPGYNNSAGLGGTQSAGGAGGMISTGASSGSLGLGGASPSTNYGGGGGGGYYGGGGGDNTAGGGGSSYIGGVTSGTTTTGGRSGNGQVIITY